MRSSLIISRQFTDPGTPRVSSFSVPNVYIPFQTEREGTSRRRDDALRAPIWSTLQTDNFVATVSRI